MEKEKKEIEYWNSLLTEKSWKILQELKRSYNFILIGGWAVYLLAKKQKSKDIDIVISISELQKFDKSELRKNDNLKKYEIKKEEIDIDIYVEYYSKLSIPVEDIKSYTIKIEGFEVACPELLLILKQGAYQDRKESVKGEKDRLDLLSLLFFSEIDFKKYLEILKKYKKENWLDELKMILANFKDYNLIGLTLKEFKLKKEKMLEKIRKT